MTIQFDLIQTVGLAVCVYLLGRWIKSKVTFFQKYFIVEQQLDFSVFENQCVGWLMQTSLHYITQDL